MEDTGKFVAYEHKTFIVRNEKIRLFLEVIENFGWIITDQKEGVFKSRIRLKRDTKLKSNRKLRELEKQLELAFIETERLETTYKDNATLLAILMGVSGSALMAGAYFTFAQGNYLWMVILAIPAFLLWILIYPLYKLMVESKKKKSNAIINQYYDMIYRISEEAFEIQKV